MADVATPAPAPPSRIALFDLDHTLIPFDSGMAWTRFLVARGVLDPQFEATYLAHCHSYVAGRLDIHAMHREMVQPLRALTRPALDGWLDAFEATLPALLPAASLAVVARHRADGQRLAIVTATTHFIAERFARAFGIDTLLATRAALDASGLPTGEIDGLPCYRQHKVAHVEAWLAGLGTQLAAVERSWFYSDSASDLPLLQAVTDPVAVRPDARLLAVAREGRWPIEHW